MQRNTGLALLSDKPTISSLELLDIVNEYRAQSGESLARRNQFHDRVVDELEGEHYQILVVENSNNTASQVFELSIDQCMLVAMRESKAVRRMVRDRLKELEADQSPALPNFNDPVASARAWADAKEQEQKAVAQLDAAKPAIEFARQVQVSPDAISVSKAAKIIGTGQNRLFAFMREAGWITRYNEPYQAKIESGHLDVKIGGWDHPDHGLQRSVTTLITGKGLAKLQSLWSHRHEGIPA